MRLIIASLIVLTASTASASVPDSVGIRCIIGEASGDGEAGMQAIAEALQQRGTTRGVYGCHAAHINREPAYVWAQARRAWDRAKSSHVTQGATFWASLSIDKGWIRRMERAGYVRTAVVGNNAFYKEVKNRRVKQ